MRKLFLLAVASLLTACASQQSHVKLYPGAEQPNEQLLVVEIPNTLEVLNINDQPSPAANRMLGNQHRQLQLQPGEYRINAYFKDLFNIDGVNSEVIRSNSATFHINGKAGDVWQLEFDAPRNHAEAKAMQDNFNGWAVNTRTGERVEAEQGPALVSLFSQLLGGGAVTSGNRDNSIAPIGTQATPAAPVVAPASSSEVAEQTLPHDDATLVTLQQIWRLLSPESRAAFLKWANQ